MLQKSHRVFRIASLNKKCGNVERASALKKDKVRVKSELFHLIVG